MKINDNDIKFIVESVCKQLVNEDGTFSNTFGATQQTQAQPKSNNQLPSDSKTLQTVQSKAGAVNKAASRINTANEFGATFKNWFQTLGYKPGDGVATIARVQKLVRDAMVELGYK